MGEWLAFGYCLSVAFMAGVWVVTGVEQGRASWRELWVIVVPVPLLALVWALWGTHGRRRWLCLLIGHRWRPVLLGISQGGRRIEGRNCRTCWKSEELPDSDPAPSATPDGPPTSTVGPEHG